MKGTETIMEREELGKRSHGNINELLGSLLGMCDSDTKKYTINRL